MISAYDRLHRWTGIAVLLGSLALYLKTMAPSVSFWDTGEFIASSYILGVPHPPGAPLYVLIGRLFSMLPFGEVGWRVVLMSVVTSALAVWCTYLTTAALARRVLGGEALKSFGDLRDVAVVIGAAVASLSLAVSYTFWFNATEAEVYGYSILLAALGVWLIIYWDGTQHGATNDRWLYLLAYLFGLGAGIHLLCLLTIPSLLVLAWYADPKLRRLVLVCVGLGLEGLFIVALLADEPDSAKVMALLAAVATIAVYAHIWVRHQELRATVQVLLGFGAAMLAGGALFGDAGLGKVITIAAAGWLAYHLYVTDRRALAILVGAGVLFALGYSTYTALYIRSGLNPAIDENDPETLAAFFKFLNREQYGTDSMLLTMLEPRASRVYQLWHQQFKYFFEQFPFPLLSHAVEFRWATRNESQLILISIVPYALGLGGMIWHGIRDWRRFAALAVLFVIMGFGLSFYLNMQDPQPRERHYIFGGMYYAFAMWMGIGWVGLIELVRRSKAGASRSVVIIFACLGLLLPIAIGAKSYHIQDRTGDYIANDYAYNMLQTCEPNSILFTNGDNDTFPLWYLQEVEGVRRDIRIVNLSLLNTNWYIKQLRDREPKVEIKLNDTYIDSALTDTQMVDLYKRVWNDDLKAQVNGELKRIGLDVEVVPPKGYNVMRIQDFMVIAILKWNAWKRPIHFGLTVGTENRIGLDPYLSMVGMTAKLVKEKVMIADGEALKHNLFEVYRFRGVADDEIYKDPNTARLLGNYRACVLTLADYYKVRGEGEELQELFDWAFATLPKSWELMYSASERLRDLGELEKAAKLLSGAGEELLNVYGTHPSATYFNGLGIANVLLSVYDDPRGAEQLYRKLIALEPERYEGYRELAAALQQIGDTQGAMALVRGYLKRFPDNVNAQRDEEILVSSINASAAAEADSP